MFPPQRKAAHLAAQAFALKRELISTINFEVGVSLRRALQFDLTNKAWHNT
jgi:hypothetical protein